MIDKDAQKARANSLRERIKQLLEEDDGDVEVEFVPTNVSNNSLFSNSFFRDKPALHALATIMEPKPEHVRACILEVCRYLYTKENKG